MSGDSQKKIWNTMNSSLKEIGALLDHGRMGKVIDEPIKECINAFKFDTPTSTQEFNRLLVDFVQSIYHQFKMDIPDHDAFNVAVTALNRDNGYYDALLNVIDNEQNIKQALGCLAEYLKEQFTEDYIRWVFNTKIAPLEWKVKCGIAKMVLAEDPTYLGDPTLFAGHLDILIRGQIEIDRCLYEFTGRK